MIKKLLQRNNCSPKFAVVLACALFLIACSKNEAPAPATPPPAKVAVAQTKPVQKQVSSSLRLNSPPVNQFDFSNKKDPFKPFVAPKVEQKNTPEAIKKAKRNSLPIHSFDVNQFKLIGIITGGRENQAMVTDPGGKGYVLKVGMIIGKNDGRVEKYRIVGQAGQVAGGKYSWPCLSIRISPDRRETYCSLIMLFMWRTVRGL